MTNLNGTIIVNCDHGDLIKYKGSDPIPIIDVNNNGTKNTKEFLHYGDVVMFLGFQGGVVPSYKWENEPWATSKYYCAIRILHENKIYAFGGPQRFKNLDVTDPSSMMFLSDRFIHDNFVLVTPNKIPDIQFMNLNKKQLQKYYKIK